MSELSVRNIELISNDIRMHDISFSHLADDLIDHVCCDVEDEMQKGYAFPEAYRRVMLKIGAGRLMEVQKETLYAVDKKYRIMKNTMKISGIAGTIIFGLASLFKIQHWAGAAIMMTIGAFILSLVFLPSALNVLWKETHNKGRLFLLVSAFLTGFFFICGTLFKIQHWPVAGYLLSLSLLSAALLFVPAVLAFLFRDPEKRRFRPVCIFASLGFVLYIAGFLFKIQHWPLATILTVVGTLILGFVVFPWFTVLSWKDEQNINSRFLFTVIALVIIIVPGALINLNLQFTYEGGYSQNQKSQGILHESLFRHNVSLMQRTGDSMKSVQKSNVHTATVELLGKIGRLQVSMVQESEGEPGKPAVSAKQVKLTDSGAGINYFNLSKPFHASPVKDFLLPECSARKELETGLKSYLQIISEYIPATEVNKYTSLLEPSNFLPSGSPESGSLSMMSGLHSLELLTNSILATESGVLNRIESR